MYSNKEQVNILTSLLVAHGVRHAVVCPGSRNSPIVHNLNECPDIACYPVTDERSAGFYALGMSQARRQPVVVCVTSGTALLNLAPAVAEAYYQHIPIVVISADRPAAWIDQLDGQTIPQPDALGRFVRKAVSLPEPHDDDTRWYCNRLVNEALIAALQGGCGPVHINVPITEPLFDYSVASLPEERKISFAAADMSPATLSHITRMFLQAKRPLLISGQPMNPLFDEAVSLVGDDEAYIPDFVLYIGGSIVSKRLKRFLRKAKETWVVNASGEVNDTFMNLTHIFQGDGEAVADHIRFMMVMEPHPFMQKWDELLSRIRQQADAYEPAYSQMAAVKYFERYVGEAQVHYANSTSIRLANSFAKHPVWCNRGVNGIEGSLSTAAGFSVVSDDRVCCVIGDLSFFYDRNALWNQSLRGNLRILLLNNGGGAIFEKFAPSLVSDGDVRNVMARHHTSARGMCADNGVEYHSATDAASLEEGLRRLTAPVASRPILLEVFTDAETDWACYRRYLASVSSAKH